MKAFCNLVYTNSNRQLCFTQNHMYDVFRRYHECSDTEYPDGMTHYFIMDVDIRIDGQIDEICKLRKQGVKVVLMTFDPANFLRVDNFINHDMLDKVIVFDKQFQHRFRVSSYVSDYFFNEDLFPTPKFRNSEVCVFGHLEHGRSNDFNLPRVDTNPMVKSYWNLYEEVQKYNGVAIYDTGLSEDRSRIVYYNKAKAVETLMAGRNPYCKEWIHTKRYNRFLKKYSDIPNPKEIDFSQDEIFKINELTIKELLYECEYINKTY